MIKLKSLIETHIWRTDIDTPDEVIDVVHKIITIIQRDAPKDNINDLYNIDCLYGSWYIKKSVKSNKKDWMLGFDDSNKLWEICYTINGEIYKRNKLNKSSLEYVIDRWTKGIHPIIKL